MFVIVGKWRYLFLTLYFDRHVVERRVLNVQHQTVGGQIDLVLRGSDLQSRHTKMYYGNKIYILKQVYRSGNALGSTDLAQLQVTGIATHSQT